MILPKLPKLPSTPKLPNPSNRKVAPLKTKTAIPVQPPTAPPVPKPPANPVPSNALVDALASVPKTASVVHKAITKEQATVEDITQSIADMTALVQAGCPLADITKAMKVVQQQLELHDYLADVLLPEQVGELVTALSISRKADIESVVKAKTTKVAKTATKKAVAQAAMAKLPKLVLGGLDGL